MDFIDFAGTSYLGLNKNISFLKLIQEGIEKYGINFGGSRYNNSVPDIYNEFEQFISLKLNCEDSVLASSGTLAGILISNYLKKNNYQILVAEDLHPALKCNFDSKIEFSNVLDFKGKIAEIEGQKPIAILLNSINSITLRKFKIKEFIDLNLTNEMLLVVDDSHGIGVLGENGWGIANDLKNAGLNYIIISSLAKALASEGGIISGKKDKIEEIKKFALWGGASPSPPFYFYALLRAEKIIKQQQLKLKENLNYFKEKLQRRINIAYVDDFPVFLNKDKSINENLLTKGIRISAFRYPTKNDPLVERIVLNSSHSFNEIDELFSNL